MPSTIADNVIIATIDTPSGIQAKFWIVRAIFIDFLIQSAHVKLDGYSDQIFFEDHLKKHQVVPEPIHMLSIDVSDKYSTILSSLESDLIKYIIESAADSEFGVGNYTSDKLTGTQADILLATIINNLK